MFLYNLLGFVLSIFYSYLVLPKKKGKAPKINPTIYPFLFNGMIIIPLNDKIAFHLHHWIIYLNIILISFYIKINKIIIGFSLGLFIQGILYSDSFKFICDNPY